MNTGPELEDGYLEQYQIYSRAEVLALLRELAESHTLVTIYYDGGDKFILTKVLSVNPEFEEIVFDASPDSRTSAALLASTRLVVVAFLDAVKLQFRASRAERSACQGGDAIRIRLPDSMLRLQRREFYRIATPLARPLKLVIPAGEGRSTPTELRVTDLSCGGMGVAAPTLPPLPLEPGATFAGCRLGLPDVGDITVTIEVRHVARGAGASGKTQTHCGLKFLALAPHNMTLLQRYINSLERERRSRR